MDNLNTHSEHADQPQGQQENGSPFPLPTGQVFDDHMIEQQHANLLPFGFYPEQQRTQYDQYLQFCNEQAWVSQQQEMDIQNLNGLNLLAANALIQKEEEIASLHIELQRKQDDMDLLLQYLTALSDAMNGALICMVPRVQQETNYHGSSNEFDAPGSADEAASMVRTPAEATKADLVCDVCSSGPACMAVRHASTSAHASHAEPVKRVEVEPRSG